MSRTRALAVVLLLAGIGLLWAAVSAAGGDYSLAGPRLAPVVVTVVWVVVAAVHLVKTLREKPDEAEPAGWPAPLGVLVCLAGFALALEYAGFVISAAVFIVAVAWVLGSRHLIRDAIVAVLLPPAIYFPFTRLLDIFLPAGVFPL